MAWINLTEGDVLDNLNAAEVETYREKIRDDQTDPLATILADTEQDVRDYVRGQVTSMPASGIPSGAKNQAIDIAIWRLCKRVQTGTENQRKGAYDEAIKKLEKIAKGDLQVEDPSGASGDTGSSWGSRPLITKPPKKDAEQ